VEQRLVDVDEPDPALTQPAIERRFVPRGVTDLDDARVIGEGRCDIIEPVQGLVSGLERPGELDEQTA
jgi:hypothetical protein